MQRRKAMQLLATAPAIAMLPAAPDVAGVLAEVASPADGTGGVSIHEYPNPTGGSIGDSVEVADAAFAWLADKHPRRPWRLESQRVYRISQPVPMAGIPNQQLLGDGATIQQTNPHVPVVAVGDYVGSSQVLKDLVLKHVDNRPTTAVGVAFQGNTSQSLFDNVACWNVAKGFATAPGRNSAWQIFFSNHMRGCRVGNFSHTGIELLAVNGGQTQNVFENVYLNNQLEGASEPLTCERPLHVRTMFGQIWNGLNIEHMRIRQPALFQQSQATINALHVEGVQSEAQSLLQVFSDHSTLLVNGDFLNCQLPTPGASLFSLGPHTKVHWNGGSLRGLSGHRGYIVGPVAGAVDSEFRRTNTTIVNPHELLGEDHPQFPMASYKTNESRWFSLNDQITDATYRVEVAGGQLTTTLVPNGRRVG